MLLERYACVACRQELARLKCLQGQLTHGEYVSYKTYEKFPTGFEKILERGEG